MCTMYVKRVRVLTSNPPTNTNRIKLATINASAASPSTYSSSVKEYREWTPWYSLHPCGTLSYMAHDSVALSRVVHRLMALGHVWWPWAITCVTHANGSSLYLGMKGQH